MKTFHMRQPSPAAGCRRLRHAGKDAGAIVLKHLYDSLYKCFKDWYGAVRRQNETEAPPG